MEKRGGSGNIALFTSKPEKTPNMKIKYGHKQRGIRRKDRTQKDATRNDYNISLENTQQHENIPQYTKTTESTQK